MGYFQPTEGMGMGCRLVSEEGRDMPPCSVMGKHHFSPQLFWVLVATCPSHVLILAMTLLLSPLHHRLGMMLANNVVLKPLSFKIQLVPDPLVESHCDPVQYYEGRAFQPGRGPWQEEEAGRWLAMTTLTTRLSPPLAGEIAPPRPTGPQELASAPLTLEKNLAALRLKSREKSSSAWERGSQQYNSGFWDPTQICSP